MVVASHSACDNVPLSKKSWCRKGEFYYDKQVNYVYKYLNKWHVYIINWKKTDSMTIQNITKDET